MVSKKKADKVAKYAQKHSDWKASEKFGLSMETVARYKRVASGVKERAGLSINVDGRPEHLPKVLIFDIETSPILARVWSLWKQNVGLSMIKEDSFIISYSAKWLGVDGVVYQDLRGVIEDGSDAPLLGGIWQLLNDADCVITQNGKNFDVKRLNARFIISGYQPPSGYKHIDTLVIAKRIFGFTSNKLEFMTDKLCKKHKKMVKRKFSGFELWKECLADNLDAWKEMEAYNKLDVLSLEELYYKFAAWDDKAPNFNLYSDNDDHVCRCGSVQFTRNGYAYTAVSKFQKFRCKKCGAETRGRVNLFTKEKRASLKNNILN